MIKLIVGLGNVGANYAQTRHNAGFWLVEKVADRFGITLNHDKKFHGMVGRGNIAGCDVRLLMPDTFMNKSGTAVVAMTQFYNIHADEMLVVHDELDIAAGLVRLKTDGGHGGHNGLRDIVPHVGSAFHRLRIGIGRPAQSSQVSNFVLSRPSGDERIAIDCAIDCAIDHLPLILAGEFDKARNHINSFKLPN